jgi:arginine N-succinyltransferase
MTHVLRAASQDDLPAIYEMASTGGGFTNLPADRPKLKDKLDSAAASFARQSDDLVSDMYMFVLEDLDTGKVRGTCQIFSCIGTDRPHYSYRIDAFTHYSSEFSRAIRSEMLTLVTDHNGSSEVGGLFLHPTERSAGAGSLLARSRYLFMAMHRARFADRTLAELRGVIDEVGVSPFWDGVTGRFFGMSFREADEFKAVRGAQFIADLMPKHPIYTAMVPESAMAVMGIPTPRAGRRSACWRRRASPTAITSTFSTAARPWSAPPMRSPPSATLSRTSSSRWKRMTAPKVWSRTDGWTISAPPMAASNRPRGHRDRPCRRRGHSGLTGADDHAYCALRAVWTMR